MLSINAEELRDLRLGAGLTQQALADMLTVDRKVISDVERGVRIPDVNLWLNWIHISTDIPLKLDFEHGGKVLQPA